MLARSGKNSPQVLPKTSRTKKNMPEDVAKDRALEHIQTILETKGKKNSHFKGLPDPKGFKEEVWLDAHVRAEMAFDWEEE